MRGASAANATAMTDKKAASGEKPVGSHYFTMAAARDQSCEEISGKKKRRRREEGLKLSREEWMEVNPILSSLLFPWIFLAVLAVISTIAMSSENPPSSLSDLTSSLTSNVQRIFNCGGSSDTPLSKDNSYRQQQPAYFMHRLLSHRHHPALFPLTTSDYVGFFLATMGLMVAAGGGIGGGGILVPIYSLVFNFSAKHAIPLSNITVFGGAVANTILNAKKRHPLADRPLVDWDLILVMEPLTIAGALIGAFLNKLLPESVLTFMLVVLLSFTSYTSLGKAIKMYKIESLHLREQGYREDGTKESELTKLAHDEHDLEDVDASERLLDGAEYQDSDDVVENDNDPPKEEKQTEAEGTDISDVELLETEASKKKQLEQILEEERSVHMINIQILVAMFVVVLTINLLKGGGAFKSPIGIVCGSLSFWIANAIILVWIVVISLFVRAYLVNRWRIKQRVGYQYVEGDIKWDPRATIVYPCICALAGFFAGMFGVGGGIVKGPLMLAMGVHPAVSSASSACMILFTSFTATTSFIVFGLLVNDYAVVCFLLGFVATYIGQVGLSYLMRKSQRNSYIAFSIGGVVLLSAILMTFQSLLAAAEGEREKTGGICGKT